MTEHRVAGNTATSTLKLIALLLMLTDHAGKMLLPGVPLLRVIGRMAFPLYAWCMAVGFTCTRSPLRYMLRVLGVGLVSQPLYMLALRHTWLEPNIFLTLALGLAGLWGIREKRAFSHLWAPVLVLMLAVWLRVDYGWRGVLLILLLYAVRESRSAIAALMIAFCLFWGSGSSELTSYLGLSVSRNAFAGLGSLLNPWMRLQTMAILALPLMLMRWNERLRMPTWLGYALYPLHLLLLYGLERLLPLL